MAFSFGSLLSLFNARMIPSLARFPFPKGTVTRTPGFAFSARFSGIV